MSSNCLLFKKFARKADVRTDKKATTTHKTMKRLAEKQGEKGIQQNWQ